MGFPLKIGQVWGTFTRDPLPVDVCDVVLCTHSSTDSKVKTMLYPVYPVNSLMEFAGVKGGQVFKHALSEYVCLLDLKLCVCFGRF